MCAVRGPFIVNISRHRYVKTDVEIYRQLFHYPRPLQVWTSSGQDDRRFGQSGIRIAGYIRVFH